MPKNLEQKINQFQDAQNRNWVVRVTVNTMRSVRDNLGIDLADTLDPSKDVVDRLTDDPILMMDVVYLCCKPQMDGMNVTVEDFSDSLTGEAIEQASQALIDAIIDFFPRSKTQIIRESLAMRDRMVKRLRKKALKGLKEVTDEQVEEAVNKFLEKSGD